VSLQPPTDPMERIVFDALAQGRYIFHWDPHPACKGLDFYLPAQNIFIEVKRFHSDRIGAQMARGDNVIALQGRDAVLWFAQRLGSATPL
jgi:hypothetical protein